MTPSPAAYQVMEVSCGVWVGIGSLDTVPVSTYLCDLRRTAGLPTWRTRDFLAGRGLLRTLLRQIRESAAAARVDVGPRGGPHLDGHPDLGISLSHDNGMVAAAVAVGRSVGVDVQHPAARPSRTLARRCLHDRMTEFDALSADDAARELAWVWTAQEACVKATGQGMAGRPWTINVPLGARSGRWRGHRWLSLRDQVKTPLSCAFTEAYVPWAEGR